MADYKMLVGKADDADVFVVMTHDLPCSTTFEEADFDAMLECLSEMIPEMMSFEANPPRGSFTVEVVNDETNVSRVLTLSVEKSQE